MTPTTLQAMLAHRASNRLNSPQCGGELWQAIVRVVGSRRGLAGQADNCLVRSYVCCAVALRFGVDCRLVIGVDIDPWFRSHAWVVSSFGVYDDARQYQTFSPILVVRAIGIEGWAELA